jgi:hypothetical protein
MRPKARWMAQQDGPPGWLEESGPAGCDCVRDGLSMPPALTDHTTCPGLGLYITVCGETTFDNGSEPRRFIYFYHI